MAGQEKRSGGPRMTIETNDSAAGGASQASSARAPKPAVEATPAVAETSGQVAAAPKTSTSKPKVKVQQPPQPAAQPQPAPQPAVQPQPAPQPAVQPQSVPQPQPASEEWRQEPAAAQPAGQQSQSNAAEAASADTTSKQPQKPRMTFSEWVHKTFPGHENAFYGAILALIVALLVFIIGVWRTLLLVILVVAGIAIGQVFDGNPKIINAIRGLFESDRSRQ